MWKVRLTQSPSLNIQNFTLPTKRKALKLIASAVSNCTFHIMRKGKMYLVLASPKR